VVATKTGNKHDQNEPVVEERDYTRWWNWGAFTVLGVMLLVLAAVLGHHFSGPPSSDVDVGFLQDMTSHHDQAVQMATFELANGQDQSTKDYALEVLTSQRWELGKMAAMLQQRGLAPLADDPGRPVMRWMGMGGTLSEMPGIASDAQMNQLQHAHGRDADVLFLQMMTRHHQGGLHMADYAAQHASDPNIRTLAKAMAEGQRGDIVDYGNALQRLGATLDSPVGTTGN
jgi:uncharacterized protein (DUF305 family)